MQMARSVSIRLEYESARAVQLKFEFHCAERL